mmetsp:Transcript_9251/g.13521  ORF Transcript_9251/g.13521 Transcript_9251/m.13521 type:complete len:225 (-) Transcript_9251:839-1513(-)
MSFSTSILTPLRRNFLIVSPPFPMMREDTKGSILMMIIFSFIASRASSITGMAHITDTFRPLIFKTVPSSVVSRCTLIKTYPPPISSRTFSLTSDWSFRMGSPLSINRMFRNILGIVMVSTTSALSSNNEFISFMAASTLAGGPKTMAVYSSSPVSLTSIATWCVSIILLMAVPPFPTTNPVSLDFISFLAFVNVIPNNFSLQYDTSVGGPRSATIFFFNKTSI